MNQTTEIINQVLPIILLIGLGSYLRVAGFIGNETVNDLKKIVVNIALPSILFISFSRIELEPSYFGLSLIIFSICIALFLIGKVLQPIIAKDHPYYPFMITGFEYGMLGVSLFGSAYGLSNIGYIAIVDLGHEIFIWFVLLPLMLAKRGDGGGTKDLAKTFLTNPVVISIILGLSINLLGFGGRLGEVPILGAITKVLEFLSGLTIPLILLVVGYGIRLSVNNIGEVLKVILVRYSIILPLIFIVNHFVIDNLLGLEKAFQIAFVTLFILPSPFIIPLFMKDGLLKEKEYINNILAVQTVITIVIFSIYVIFNPQL